MATINKANFYYLIATFTSLTYDKCLATQNTSIYLSIWKTSTPIWKKHFTYLIVPISILLGINTLFCIIYYLAINWKKLTKHWKRVKQLFRQRNVKLKEVPIKIQKKPSLQSTKGGPVKLKRSMSVSMITLRSQEEVTPKPVFKVNSNLENEPKLTLVH
jgi:hypothetical protein